LEDHSPELMTTADSLDARDDPVRIRKATLADVPAIRPLTPTFASGTAKLSR